MEQHVENLLKSHQQRMERRMQLETEMKKIGLSEEAQCQMRRMLSQKESNYIRLKRAKMDKAMFVKIKGNFPFWLSLWLTFVKWLCLLFYFNLFPYFLWNLAIGVGAFGEVALVRKIDTNNHLYAMKTLRKTDVLKRNQVKPLSILPLPDCYQNTSVTKFFFSYLSRLVRWPTSRPNEIFWPRLTMNG